MDMTSADWRKSSYSGANGGNCIEVAAIPGGVALRDSKDPDGPRLTISPDRFREFVAALKR
jgi:Domain of unknown function (DUF397)